MTLKEILITVRDVVSELPTNDYNHYLCNKINELHCNNIITDEERLEARQYIQDNKKIAVDLYKADNSWAFWQPCEKQLRIDFLNHLINEL